MIMEAKDVDLEQGGREIKDTEGVFSLVIESGEKKLNHVVFCENIGLRSQSEPDIGMELGDIIGVHLNQNEIRYVGYRIDKSGCFCGSKGKLVKEQVRLIVTGKENLEENIQFAKNWYESSLEILGRNVQEMKKPLLVFINPKSGPGNANKIWNDYGNKLIGEDAGHLVEVITTNRQNHALEYVRDHDDLCKAYKGICIVSGDGLIYEIIQGIMQRKDWAHCVRHIPIGILPGGTGNGLARTLCAEANIPYSPQSCAFIVAKHHTQPLDVAAVDIGNGENVTRAYSFLSMEWALASDIDIGSEYMRSLGEARFTIEAIKRLIALRKYNGKLSYLPCVEGEETKNLPRSAKSSKVQTPKTYWEEHADLIDSTNAETPHLNLLPEPDQPIPESWETVQDTFWSMWNCNMAWMSGSSCLAPHARPGDGHIQLQFLRQNGPQGMSRWKLFKYLIGLDGGEHQNKKFVEMTPTRAYRFEPKPNPDGKTKGIIALDGEVVEYTQLQMQVLRGFLQIFSLVDE